MVETSVELVAVSDRWRSRLLLACEGSRWIPRRVDQGRGGPRGNGGAGTGRSGSGSGEPTEGGRERRLRLDPDQLAREQRIDEAAVDVEVAWEDRAAAEQAVADAEIAAAAAIERLLASGSRSRTWSS